jgi:predicted NBD/HSP70 family sugar kinase
MVGGSAVGQRSETVRRVNLSAIVRELHANGPLSRSELVARTGLTRTAIRGLIGELVAADLATEERAPSLGTPGRPSPVVRLNAERSVVLALEIAVDSLAVAVVGLGGAVLHHARVDRPRGHLSVDEIVADLAELARVPLRSWTSTSSVIGIGLAVAGIVRRGDGFVLTAPNLGWRSVRLAARLGSALKTDLPISIGNEADLGAVAEHRRGAAVGESDVVFISGEVGVGGGIIVDGRPLAGIEGYGGEVGHIPVNPSGRACGCGSVGCWETEVGERALLTRAGHSPDGGREAVDAVLRDAQAARPRALSALAEVGRWLGFGLAGLVNVLNPRLVVLGGLFARIYPFVVETTEGELDRLALPASRALIRLAPARLGVEASLLGAAELAFEPLLQDPAAWLGRPQGVGQLVGA